MRNAMICVSVMLAVFLGWPLAFGGRDTGLETVAAETRPLMPAAAIAATPRQSPMIAVSAQVPSEQPESCYKHYQREVRLCTGRTSAACRLDTADHWDMCEATGFWPD